MTTKKEQRKCESPKNMLDPWRKKSSRQSLMLCSKKTLKAAQQYNAKSVILGGGVSANEELRKQLAKELKKEKVALFLPEKSLATDNGIMPALAGYFLLAKKRYPKDLKSIAADPNLHL